MSASAPVAPNADGDSALFADGGVDVSLIAHLAFARAADASVAEGRHLALLPNESLELDLSDPAQRQFGDYELLELIGEGGMGVVYRARQASLDREVAIKLLAAGVWASSEFVQRFRREAQNAARMQHPNIVPVYEVGEYDELHFFSMRLIHGPSLAAELKREKKIPAQRAAQLLRTVAEAVDYAHRLGVLHLDLKPANVLIDENGTPHVADFGLARRLDSALAADSDEVSGTPSYMAPEQASPRTRRITPATDIWGLGAILYELVSGEPPFLGASPQDTLKLVVEGALRSPRRYSPDLPRDLEAIILKCMARDVGERYASARDLADDLSRFLEGRAVRARPLNAAQRALRWARREPRLAAALLAAFAALAIGLGATTQQWRRADANAAAARENLWATRAQTAHAALAGGDGFRGLRDLAANLAEMQAAGRSDEAAVERQRIGTILANAPQLTGLLRLPAGERASSIAIAPDARHFAVATNQDGTRRVRQYETEGLRETWMVPTNDRTFLMAYGDHGAPHSGLHYTADGRFLLVALMEQPIVPAPRYSDMVAFDARDGRVIWPEGPTEPHADIVFDDALKHALVRYRSDKSLRWPDAGQFYDVDGWRPIGPRHPRATTLAADMWLPAPDGSAWLGTRDSARLALYSVPALKPLWELQLPESGLIRAWRFSHDGRTLALGGVDGAVRLVDVASGRAAELDSGPSTRVLRVEFDAADRNLAAVDENGQLWVWDTATRLPRAAPLRALHGGNAAVLIRFAGDTVFGGGVNDGSAAELAYATLAPRAPFNNEAVAGAARLHGDTFGTAFDVAADRHRLITAGAGGLIELWRLPQAPLLTARAAPLPAPTLTFDGTRIVAVDGDGVRVVDAASGAPVSPPLHHPEPVRFAELSPDGAVLATIAGRTVRIIDAATWRLRGEPIVLPQSPLRAVFASSAPLLLLTTADYDGDVLHEQIHRVDLAQGVPRGPELRVESLNDFELDAQGRYALVSTWNSATHAGAGPLRIALDSGAATCAPDLGKQWYAALADNGRSAWFNVARAGSPLTLRRWDFEACREIALAERIELPEDAVLVPRGDELVVHRGGHEALIRIGADGRRRAALGDAIPGAMYKIALTADGERAALATRNAVHLLDARRGRRLSAPLTAPIGGDDAIADLAFSPDGARLLARTINGRWLFWQLPRTADDVAALARLARVLDPNPAETVTDADLAALRAQLSDAAFDHPAGAATDEPVEFAPAAGVATDPRFVPLDLAAAINAPLVGRTWPEPGESGDVPTLGHGPQRFLGVDYRVDGGVQLSAGASALALASELHRSATVRVPDITARRVHVLAFMHLPMPRGVPPRPFAYVVLTGADGRETRLEIRTVRDVVSHGNPNPGAASVRIAWMGADSASVRGGWPALPGSHVHAVALDVPATTGPIRGLRFDSAEGPMEAPLFFAATLERDVAPRPEASP